ncbi:MAG: ATP-binding protein [Acidimicrobiales bacterium]
MQQEAGLGVDDFVGRAAELKRLEEELARARTGVPRTVLVEGTPGIGKSALVRHFVDRAVVTSVLRASGDESEVRLSCGVVSQLFAGAGSPGAGLDQCGDPLVVGAELLRVIGELDARGPVLLVVDDAQWADSHSLQALTFALRRLHADPVLALLAVRDEAGALPEGLWRLGAERGAVLRLGGLGCDDLGQLAVCVGAGTLSRRALERLQEHTAGSPLHAKALLEELSPEVLERNDGSLPAPRSFSLLVLSRLAGCSQAAKRLVEATSVLGVKGELGLVACMADVEDPAGPLDEAVAAGLLEVRETPTALTAVFAHNMVRAAIYENLGRSRRSQLHAAASQLVEGPGSLDHRAAAALIHDARLAAELSAHASDETGRGDPLSAAGHLFTAARLDPDRARRERNLLDAVELLLAGGDVVGATARANEVAELSDSARRAYVLGHLALLSGRQRGAERLLRGAWESADPAKEADVRMMASEKLAELCAAQVRPEEAITWARRALQHDVDHHRGASALTTLVVYLALVGRPGEALPLVESIEIDAVEPAPREVGGVLARGIVRIWIGQLHPARIDLERVLAASRPALASRGALSALGFLAHVEYLLGRWAASMQHSALAVSLATDGGQTSLLPLLHATAALALGARGEWAEAEAHVGRAVEAAEVNGDDLSFGYAYDAEVRLAFCRDEPERVVASCRRLAGLRGQAVIAEPGVLAWCELYGDALVSLGRLDEAATVLADLEERLTTRPPAEPGPRHPCRVQGAARGGSWERRRRPPLVRGRAGSPRRAGRAVRAGPDPALLRRGPASGRRPQGSQRAPAGRTGNPVAPGGQAVLRTSGTGTGCLRAHPPPPTAPPRRRAHPAGAGRRHAGRRGPDQP